VRYDWSYPSQMAVAVLLLLGLALLGWHVHVRQAWGTRPTTQDPLTFRLDLNQADRTQLSQLPGVSPTLATQIERSRREQGPFRSVEELRRVPGIGPALYANLRDRVEVKSESSAQVDRPPPERVEVKPAPMKAAKISDPAERIPLNQASAAELQRLPGIGPAISARIIAARAQQPFKSVEDLRRVSGIGPKTVEKLRPFVTVNDP
jgi:competence protein ComEA